MTPAASTTTSLHPSNRADAICGLPSGICGGLTMLAVLGLFPAGAGGGIDAPLELLGEAMGINPPARWSAGLMLHLALTGAAGMLFARLWGRNVPASNVFAWGSLYGVALFLTSVYWLVPLLGARFADSPVCKKPWPLFLAHLAYGASTALVLILWRRRARLRLLRSP